MTDPVQEFIDKQSLHELVLRYCRACDRRDFPQLRALYHDDAIDDHGAMFCGSADEYLAWLPGVLANFEATVHSITNALFVVAGDAAQGRSTPSPTIARIRRSRRMSSSAGVTWITTNAAPAPGSSSGARWRLTGAAGRRWTRPPTGRSPPVHPGGAPITRIPPTSPCHTFAGGAVKP